MLEVCCISGEQSRDVLAGSLGESDEVDIRGRLCGSDVENDAVNAKGARDSSKANEVMIRVSLRTENLLKAHCGKADEAAKEEDEEAEGDFLPPSLANVLVL